VRVIRGSRANPRLIGAADNPWDWSKERGRVIERWLGRPPTTIIDELFGKYVDNTDYREPIGPQGRIIVKISPDRINTPASLNH
jgi:hypothetical protein